MYSLSNRNRRKFQKHWLSFRLYSRQVIDQPMNMDIHTSRIMAAMELDEKEPLQGALADMFYGCWFDVPYFGDRMLNQVREKLTPTLLQGFDQCVNHGEYVFKVSHLATRWSVLVSPSIVTYQHQLRVSTDDSKVVAQTTIAALLDIMEEEDDPEDQAEQIAEIEEEFFNHCLVCHDRLAFSMVWWEMSKNKWDFNDKWLETKEYFAKQVA